jgi:hypothetical protein
MTEHHQSSPPHPVPASLARTIAAETSLRSRIGHLAVGLAGGLGATLIALLWATEPDALPARTQAAFGGLIAVGLAWAAFAGWVLARRRPLYGYDQVLGAWIALTASTATGVVGVIVTAARGSAAAASAAALAGGTLVAVAVLLLVRAHRRRRGLLRRRDELRRADTR